MSTKDKPDQILYGYMLDTVNRIATESKRGEDRADKAIQLFIGLLTALFAGNVAVSTAVQDVSLKNWIFAISFLIMSGIGTLTFVWILGVNVLRQIFSMERYHLDMYFHDLDPATYDKYGQTIYSLNVHLEAIKERSNFILSSPLYLSIAALAIFNGAMFGVAAYLIWLQLVGVGSLVLASVSGIMLIVALAAFWYLSEKAISKKRLESQQLLKKYAATPKK